MSKRLANHTDTELLAELIRRNPPKPGPFRVTWSENPLVATVAIGKDNTATIYLHNDDLKVMVEINAGY